MSGKVVYLEAAGRTQDLLNAKWALRSAGFVIGSDWHDGGANLCSSVFKDHWNAREFQQLEKCDVLVVLFNEAIEAATQIAVMTGFALARNLEVCWIGRIVGVFQNLARVRVFDTAEEFRHYVLALGSERTSVSEKLAA